MKKVRKLYSSPNGDRWYLTGEASGEVFVRLEDNIASGGHVTHIEIGTHLCSGLGVRAHHAFRALSRARMPIE